MTKITEEMKEVVAKTRGFAVATATKDGDPQGSSFSLGYGEQERI